MFAAVVAVMGCAKDGARFNGPPAPTTGSVAGDVRGEGNPVPGASVKLLGAAGGVVRETTTGDDGTFSWDAVPIASYTIRAVLPRGFLPATGGDTLRTVQVTATRSDIHFVAVPQHDVAAPVGSSKPESLFVAAGATATVVVPPGTTAQARLKEDATVAVPFGETAIGLGVTLITTSTGGSPSIASFGATGTLGRFVQSVSIREAARNVSASCPAQLAIKVIDITGQTLLAQTVVPQIVPRSSDPTTVDLVYRLESDRGLFPTVSVREIKSTCVCPGDYQLKARDNQPIGSREALVLIHGLQPDRISCEQFDPQRWNPATDVFANLLSSLEADAQIQSRFKIFVYQYPTFAGVSQAATLLSSQLSQLAGGAAVRIIGHSMGGLVARQLQRVSGAPTVRRIVTLATPHAGSPLADPAIDPATDAVKLCFQSHQSSVGLPNRFEWYLVRGGEGLLGVNTTNQAKTDLAPGSALLSGLGALDQTVVTPLSGGISLDALRVGTRSSGTVGALLHFACVLETSGRAPRGHDTTVPFESSGASVLNRFDGFDHLQMTATASPDDGRLERRVIQAVLASGSDPCAAPATTLPISFFGTISGVECLINSSPAVARSIQAAQQTGLRLTISSDFHPILWVIPDASPNYVGTYTSSASSLSKKWIVPSGRYTLTFGPVFSSERGSFNASAALESSSVTACESANLVGVSQTLSQSLGSGDCVASDGSFYDTFIVYAPVPCKIEMRSTTIDSYLSIYDGDGVFIEADDDSGGGLDASIARTDCRTGAASNGFTGIRIRANSLGSGERGNYTLTITLGSGPTASQRSIAPAIPADGHLDDPVSVVAKAAATSRKHRP